MHEEDMRAEGLDLIEVVLVTELSEAMHRCGAPAHRLEDAMHRVCASLGVDIQVFATPTMLFIAHRGRSRLVRVVPGDIALSRMVAVDQIATWVSRGVLPASEALPALRAAMAAKPRFREVDVVAGFGVLSASAVVFFGGGWLDVVVAGGLGLGVGLGLGWLGRHPSTARLTLLAVSLGVALVAGLAAAVGPVDHHALTVAALIVLLPGFSLTTAMSELSTGHLSAGAARLSGVMVSFLHLAVGTAAGWSLAPPPLSTTGMPLPMLAEPVALLCSGLALVVLFQARAQDAGTIVLSAVTSYYSARLGVSVLGPLGGSFGSALLVTLLSNLQARQRDLPASLSLIPGILLLVPGTVGFRGLGAMLADRTLDGVHGAVSAFLIAAALVAGVLTANALLPARRDL